jgi:predicted kinase
MIHVMIGPSGSGKSKLAATMVMYADAPTVIINRDSLRESLFGYSPDTIVEYYKRPDIKELEKQVSIFQDMMIQTALDNGKDVILDNTHLRLSYINDLKKYQVPLTFVPVEVDFEVALDRDSRRIRKVGESVIRKQYAEFEELKKVFDFKPWSPEPFLKLGTKRVLGGYNAFIFDLDGTLAINKSGRSPYDWKRVGEDLVSIPVKKVLTSLAEFGYKIVLCSGRDEICRNETEQWLHDNEISYRELHMRPRNDMRKDSVVKEEMWKKLVEEYNIIGMFDDRKQVIDHARKHGFIVFDVANNTF